MTWSMISLSKTIPPETALALNQLINRAMDGFKVEPHLKLSEWADTHFYLSTESSGVEGPWVTLPYQRGIMNTMVNDDVPIVTVMKSARVGYTKMLLASDGYYASHLKRSVVLYQPTDSDASDFTKDEVETMIRDCPVVTMALKVDPEKRSKSNTLSRKEFIGCTLDIKGGKSPRNYRRMTKDVAQYDETDGFDIDIGGEGSCFTLGDTRTMASPFPKSMRGSTPGVQGISQIEQSFHDADVRMYRYLPCNSCGKFFKLEFGNLICEQEYQPKTVRHHCPHCAYKANYDEYPDMDEAGHWQTDDGLLWLDDKLNEFRDDEGNTVEPPEHVAFFIWGAYSYFMTWPQLMKRWFEAHEALKRTGDNTKLKTVINTVLAQTWEEDAGDKVEWEDIKSMAEDYPHLQVPMGAGLVVAGVDVQDNRLALVIAAYGKTEASWRIHYEEIMGDPDEDYVWQELDKYLARTYTHETGEQLRIESCAIDSGGHRTQSVYRYVRDRKQQCFAIKGSSTPWQPVLRKPTLQDVTISGKVHKAGVSLWHMGADTAKATIMRRLVLNPDAPGRFHTATWLGDDYFKGVTGEKLVTRYRKGFPYKEFIKTRRNEPVDCEAMAYAAAIKAGLHRIDWDSRLESYLENHQFRVNTGREREARGVFTQRPQTKAKFDD